ncbi:hypothetical protein FFLO_04733 [Filobasidium floriforme]|uniref:NAD(P)-binding protein n=1 Tax=Filobasidium floriforme TaxID=5210 RepID=A0A8K0JJU2_9TREE|nr:hypothetical protein FFLO_04733 [Filobasidium floriforme]
MSSHVLAKNAGADALQIAKLFNVDGWVCVVTGGGTGLGLTTAIALAANGAKVYITGRRAEVLQQAVETATPKSGNGSVHAVQGDAATKEGIEKMVTEISSKEKYINVLINNHGVSQGNPDITSCPQTPEGLSQQMYSDTFERWLDTYRINTASYFFTSFAFLPLLAKAKTEGGAVEPGNILNISSMSGITKTSQRGQFNYNAGKAATISLSHQLATEFARRDLGVRVNTIAPGYFPSGMTDTTTSDAGGKEAFKKDWGIPFGRPGNAVDYAQCVISTITNQYVTGAEIVIDGAWLLESAF